MDYTQLVQVLNFPSGVTERCVDIQINDNDVLDMFQENFFLNVVSNDADIAPGGGQATIQIVEDNDQSKNCIIQFDTLCFIFLTN